MENDDELIGQILNRRETLALLGKAGAAMFAGYGLSRSSVARAETNSCVVKPALTEGPYWVDEKLNRSDVRTDPSTGSIKPGVPLQLTFNVSRASSNSCSPLAGALVDIWHCDALGTYSDVQAQNTVGQKFLRGYQVTDANGQAQITTIYPGWYVGRAVHIHFRIRTGASAYQSSDFVSQLFFDDSLTDQVHAQQPYATKGSSGRTRNAQDMIYQQGGNQLVLALTPSGGGYMGAVNLGVAVACANLTKGDVNADEAVNTADATYALRATVGLEKPNDCVLSAGDMNGDGLFDLKDVIAILQKAIGL